MNSTDTNPCSCCLKKTYDTLTIRHHWDHFLARIGILRSQHRVAPGLYRLGNPTPTSPVFVTANYTLSFDALRSHLKGLSAFILVLDTRGINVWCAAGKGTFGTWELLNKIKETGLADSITHRKLILPQLGATGVSAHTIKKESGFKVEYGPVRAADIPEYLHTGKASAEMRKVRFTWKDRMVLIPVELKNNLALLLIASLIFYFIGGWLAVAGITAAALTGLALFPLLLPLLPFPNFSVKGFILGSIPAVGLGILQFLSKPDLAVGQRIGLSLPYILGIPALTAFFALNFTGSTTFTSPSGVRREIYRYIPRMAGMAGISLLLIILLIFIT